MSTLIVQLPAPPRLAAPSPERAADAADTAPEWDWVLVNDAQQVLQQGRGPLSALPAATSRLAVLPPQALAWHRLDVPRAPAARLRAALAGLLEDALLDDEADVHFALAPGWKAGEPGWVAACHRPWLQAQLSALEADGGSVDRLLPAWAPEGPVAAHLFSPGEGQGHLMAWRDEHGPVCLPLAGGAAKAWLAGRPADEAIAWSAAPDCAEEAAHLAGNTVAARSLAQGLQAAALWEGNLRQFDLAPQHRGSRLLREAWRRFRTERAWRPVRWGLVALVAVQLVGLNAWAWQQRQALARQKASVTALLQGSFPHVRAVIDAPAQMGKELERLRTAAGRPGDTDLEPMLRAADAAWPPSRGPAESIRFEPGRLTLASPGWTPPEVDGFRERLRAFGLDAEAAPGRLVVARLDPGRAPPAPAAAAPALSRPPVSAAPAGARPAAPPQPIQPVSEDDKS